MTWQDDLNKIYDDLVKVRESFGYSKEDRSQLLAYINRLVQMQEDERIDVANQMDMSNGLEKFGMKEVVGSDNSYTSFQQTWKDVATLKEQLQEMVHKYRLEDLEKNKEETISAGGYSVDTQKFVKELKQFMSAVGYNKKDDINNSLNAFKEIIQKPGAKLQNKG